MARQSGQLADWGDEIPQEVLDLAEIYDTAHTAKSAASAEVNTARDNLIAKMGELGVSRVPIRNGDKFLTIKTSENVRYQKPKKAAHIDDDEEPDGVSRTPEQFAATASAAAPVATPKRTRKAKPKSTGDATKPTSEPGPEDPPPSRFNSDTPFAGLEVPTPWLARFIDRGFPDCWALLAACEEASGLKALEFAEANLDALRNALSRWEKTGHYIDGCRAAYEAGVAAFELDQAGDAFDSNPHATNDPRCVRWRDGWLEAESSADPADNEDDE